MEATMSSDFYSNELLVRERVGAKYQEAEAWRLANTARRISPVHHSILRSAGQALREVTQVVQAVIYQENRQSPVPRKQPRVVGLNRKEERAFKRFLVSAAIAALIAAGSIEILFVLSRLIVS